MGTGGSTARRSFQLGKGGKKEPYDFNGEARRAISTGFLGGTETTSF